MEGHRFLFLVFAFICWSGSVSALENGKVKITVGTTAGCVHTVNFIQNQLVPTYEVYGEFLELKFVPWGRTIRDENGEFTFCQFRPSNCWANRMQRCSLNLLRDNQTRQLEFMSCEFTTPFPGFNQESYTCARAVGLNVVDVDYCLNNPQLDTLDDEAEEAAAEPMEIINGIPYIMFDDVADLETAVQARQRLASMVCCLLAQDPSSGISDCQI